MQRTALHKHRGNRAAALVEVGLDDEAGGQCIWIGLELEDIGLQDDGLKQVVDIELLLCRDVDEHVRTAPFLGDDAVFGQLLAYAVGVGARLIDLVDRHDDGHVSCLRMVDGLDRLRHDAVVCGNDEHDDVGDLGTAGAHCCERLVTRRVDEGDLLAVDVDDRCADVLGDAAGLARNDAGMANRVEQRGLAVIDMTHDGDDGRTGHEVVLGVVVHDGVLLFGRHDAYLAPEVIGYELDQVVGHGLGKRENLPEHEQALDDVVGLDGQKLCKLGDRGALRHLDD